MASLGDMEGNDMRLSKNGHVATIIGPSFSMRMLYKRLAES
jgi:hypothetical protein